MNLLLILAFGLLTASGTILMAAAALPISRSYRQRHKFLNRLDGRKLHVFGAGAILLIAGVIVGVMKDAILARASQEREMPHEVNIRPDPTSSDPTGNFATQPESSPLPKNEPVPATPSPRVKSTVFPSLKNRGANLSLAKSLIRSGDYTAAVRELDRLIALDPANPEARDLRDWAARQAKILNQNR